MNKRVNAVPTDAGRGVDHGGREVEQALGGMRRRRGPSLVCTSVVVDSSALFVVFPVVTQANAAGAEESASASEELSAQARELIAVACLSVLELPRVLRAHLQVAGEQTGQQGEQQQQQRRGQCRLQGYHD